jgi:secreted PhoX family phosphatase
MPNTTMSRRSFLRRGAVLAGGALVTPAVLQSLALLGTKGRVYAASGDGGYGPLFPTADLRDGVLRISLPAGFQYRSFGVAGTLMSDGNLTPLAHDGMAAYRHGRTIRLVRNHEDRNAPDMGSTAGDPTKKYDPRGGGGTTTLVIDPVTRELVRDFISLNGTIVNCAGGPTPWKSWLTCEETTEGPTRGGWGKPHGYVFDVPVQANNPVDAIPFPAMGRFSHEAVAVDPTTWIVYETEDNSSNSGFYRYIPKRRGRLAEGKLEMLAIDGAPNYDTRTGQVLGKKLPVTWVPIPDPDPAAAEANQSAVFLQGFAAGGARFARLEGCWYGQGSIFIVSTNGGNAGVGQVWEYQPRGRDKDTLSLIFESPSAAVLDGPDNITVSPHGGLVLCEDGAGDQFLQGITPEGENL